MNAFAPRFRAVIVVLVLAFASAGHADTLEERFAAANALYGKNRHAEARTAYESLIERFQVRAPAVHYNLGNAEFELGNLGRAVLNYKRALGMSPSPELEAKVRENLAIATKAIIDRHRKDPSGKVTVLDETHGVAYSVFQILGPRISGPVFGATWVLFFAVMMLRRYRASREGVPSKSLRSVAIVLAVPMVLSGTLFVGNAITSETVVRGVIVKSNVRLREPGATGGELTDVPEGLEVRILDTTDPAEVRVRLSNGKEGWVPAKAIEAV
jgi:hypothetical protein